MKRQRKNNVLLANERATKNSCEHSKFSAFDFLSEISTVRVPSNCCSREGCPEASELQFRGLISSFFAPHVVAEYRKHAFL